MFPAIFLLSTLVHALEAEKFTVDQIISAPFPIEIAAAPTGNAVAWVFNKQGVRNVWVAEPPAYFPRAITTFDHDDGQEITGLVWTSEANAVLFVRGGPPNASGEIPNPETLPLGAKRSVWIAPLGPGEPERITEGHSPLVLPNSSALLYINNNTLWKRDRGDKAEPERLLKVRGGLSSLRLSPDGKRLAFVSSRDRRAFVGVYKLASKNVTWLAPGVDIDSNPAWSPDSQRVAFSRAPTPGTRFLFTPERSAHPWSIWIADATTGQGRQLWQADPGPGSVPRPVVAKNQLFWSADNRIVFPWERDGWNHLYTIHADGGTPRNLTPGAFEIQHVSLSQDGTRVYFSANKDDIDRRHLWSVETHGGPLTALTPGTGIEWSAAPLSDNQTLAFLRSDARKPARPAIRFPDGAIRDLAPGEIPADFPHEHFVDPVAVTITATDGREAPAQLFMPDTPAPPEGRPAAIFMHGGSRRQMLLGWHHGEYYHNAYGLNQYLASRGFVVLSLNYRSGVGYGLNFREAIEYGAAGASELRDVLGAGLYLQNLPEVDPNRVGLWGGSYGGYLTALGLARASDMFAAGVDIHGVHDWNPVIKGFLPFYNALENPERAELALESSPLASVEQWRSPVLLIHGDDDRNVPFTETTELAAQLRKHNVPFEYLVFPDEVHGFLLHRNWSSTLNATAEFLIRHLNNPAQDD